MSNEIEPTSFTITVGDKLFTGWYTICDDTKFCAFKCLLPDPSDVHNYPLLQCDMDFFELDDERNMIEFLTSLPRTWDTEEEY